MRSTHTIIKMKRKSVSVHTCISAVSPVFKQEKDLSAEGSPVLWRLALLSVKFEADRPKVECPDQRRNWEVGICTQRGLILCQVWPQFHAVVLLFDKGFSQTSMFLVMFYLWPSSVESLHSLQGYSKRMQLCSKNCLKLQTLWIALYLCALGGTFTPLQCTVQNNPF